jgi:two-component system NarL family response regulator
MPIKVILADDHSIVRDGLKAVIEKKGDGIKIIGVASNGNDVLNLSKNNPADIYILDISMPILNGIETAHRLVKKDPQCKVIMLSMHDDRTYVEKALQSGARGYILKESATDEIVFGINEVYLGRYYLTPKISSYLVEDFLSREPGKQCTVELSSREKGILQLLAEGFNNKEIAEKLSLSLNTVHVHRNNIMKKLNIHRQADLIKYALKEGIVQL